MTRKLAVIAGSIALTLLLLMAMALPGAGSAATADQFTLSGEVIQSIGYSFFENELTDYKLNLNSYLEKPLGFSGKVHIGVKANKDEIGFDELYGDMYLDTTDIRVGYQAVSWGTADGLNPTSVINPLGIDLANLNDGELKGKPVPAVKADYYADWGSLEGVVVFKLEPSQSALDILTAIASNNTPDESDDLPYQEPSRAFTDLEDLEYALRTRSMIGSYDLYLSYFNGFEDAPAAWMPIASMIGGQPLPGSLQAEYRRFQQFGLATAGAVSGSTVWAEAAYNVPRGLDQLSLPGNITLSSNDPYLQAVVGFDKTLDNELRISSQLMYDSRGSLLNPYLNPGEERGSGYYGLFTATYPVNDFGELQFVTMIGFSDQSGVLVPAYDWDIGSSTTISAGYVHFFGADTSEFGRLSTQVGDQINLALKYSF